MTLKTVLASVAISAFMVGGAQAANTLYAADNLTDGSLSGVVELGAGSLSETGSFLTSGTISGLATNGTNVYASLPTGISEYTTAGAYVGQYANLGNDHFEALGLSDGTLYAADNLTNASLSGVVEFNAASLLETSSFLTSGTIYGLATNGTDIYVSLPDGISEYTTAGAYVGQYANLGNDHFEALGLSDGTLYAADNLTDASLSGVVEFNAASLLETSSFLTSGTIYGLATNGTGIYVSLPDGISEYTTAGAYVGQYANLGSDHFDALALPSGAPEPSIWAMMLVGIGGLGASLRMGRKQTVVAA